MQMVSPWSAMDLMLWFSKVFLCHQSALMVTTAQLRHQTHGFIDALLAITTTQQPLLEAPAL
jgi:hypothetical protein